MMISPIATSYAKALFEVSKSEQVEKQVYTQLNTAAEGLTSDALVHNWLNDPSVKAEARLQTVQSTFKGKVHQELYNLLQLLAERDRLAFIDQIAKAFQKLIDKDNQVMRGEVRSAVAIDSSSRERLEKQVAQVTGKQVILNYVIDPSVIGGLVAKVGSYTFDDSLDSHLRRLNEELKRRAH